MNNFVNYDYTNSDVISAFLSENYVEDDNNRFRYNYSNDFIYWYLSTYTTINIGIKQDNELIGFICGRVNDLMLNATIIKAAEINFLCIKKTVRNNKLCPLLIKEITKRFNEIGIYEAIYTNETLYKNPLTKKTEYYVRFLDIKTSVDIGYIISKATINEIENKLMLPKLKTGSKRLVKLDNHNYIDKCFELYNKYFNKFKCYEVFTKDLFIKTFINEHINTFVLIENENVLDFISYYTIDVNVLQKNIICKDAYIYYYTNTNNSYHKMLLMLLHTISSSIISFICLDIMDNDKDTLESLGFINKSTNFNYYLFNNNIVLPNRLIAKILF
jgi:glycylpeptide N-tetradecanoyltransferase